MILFGIVCFRENYKDTITYRDLVKSFIHDNISMREILNVFIFDNTDFADWKVNVSNNNEENVNVSYFHDPSNPGISFAYNKIAQFAKENTFDNVVFLDQDTKLPLDFFYQYKRFEKKNKDIGVPKIYEKDKLISPSKYKAYRSSFYNEILESQLPIEGNSCINSGILIRTDFFYEVGGYNERLRLDFCDHEFIGRIKNYVRYLNIIPVKLKQNFSTNTNSKEKALFRYKLFITDMKVFKNIHNKFLVTLFVDLPHLIRLSLQYKSFLFVRERFLKNDK
ncbi:glycosyltransferase family protein [Chryseobacterium sp. CT-SW4]|uniref:hypothetical protein n=1 Tax=Chryseobacterium sp. SW-1 TaxID=3157343 RepID=UPI003B0259E9